MAYSFTEKKRIRKDFGKRQSILEVPYLLAIQLDSYREFLQADTAEDRARRAGPACRVQERVPDLQLLRQRASRIRELPPRRSGVRRQGVPLRGLTYGAPLRVKVRLVVYDKESSTPTKKTVKDIREQEVYMGEMPLMTDNGTFIVNGTERVIVSQLHRSPGVFFDHDRGKTHSSGKLLFSARIIPYRGSWLDFEFDPKDCVFARIDRRRKLPVTIILRALGYTDEQMLDMFFEKNTYHLSKGKIEFELVPERLRGETADVHRSSRRQGHRRGRPAHHRAPRAQLEQKNVTRLEVPNEYLIGQILAHDVVNTKTGEMLAKANEILTIAIVDKLIEAGIDADPHALRQRSRSRSVHLRHAAHRSDQHAPRGAGRDLPHDASGRAADQGRGGEPVPEPVLQLRSATTCRRSAA